MRKLLLTNQMTEFHLARQWSRHKIALLFTSTYAIPKW